MAGNVSEAEADTALSFFGASSSASAAAAPPAASATGADSCVLPAAKVPRFLPPKYPSKAKFPSAPRLGLPKRAPRPAMQYASDALWRALRRRIQTADGGATVADGGATMEAKVEAADGGATVADGGATVADGGATMEQDDGVPDGATIVEPTPGASSGCGPGHPMCLYYDAEGEDKCNATLEARLVKHVLPNGQVGDLYCDKCWGELVNLQPKLQCKELGHPMCAQNRPDEDEPSQPHHMCTGSPKDKLVRHVHQGKELDLYCTTCWNAFQQGHEGLEGTAVPTLPTLPAL